MQRQVRAATSVSTNVHSLRSFFQHCCSVELPDYFLCKACYLKAEKGAKSQAVVDTVQTEAGSCLRGRSLLGEDVYILPVGKEANTSLPITKLMTASCCSCQMLIAQATLTTINSYTRYSRESPYVKLSVGEMPDTCLNLPLFTYKDMPIFRWPDLVHDIALVKEIVANRPTKPLYWEAITITLSSAFSTTETLVELKGRGCRERLDWIIEKFKAEDAKSLKR